jgi:hypothetical protein
MIQTLLIDNFKTSCSCWLKGSRRLKPRTEVVYTSSQVLMLHVHPILGARFAILVMRNIWCEVAPQGLLSYALQSFHVGYIKDSGYSKKPASVLPNDKQIHVEFAHSNTNKKTLCGNLRICALNMMDNNLNNFCSFSS